MSGVRERLAAAPLGLGCAQFGNLYRETTGGESRAAVDAAWETGVRYFDTAPHYGLGLSERRLGAALADRPREEYLLSTKVGRLLVDDPGGADRQDDEGFVVPASQLRVWDFSADGVRRSLDASLLRLGLDRIDIVYVHDPDDHLDTAIDEALPALARLRDEGVIGAIGAGMNHAAPLARIVREADVDLVMCAGRYTLIDREAEEELLPDAQERGVGIVVAGVYNSGLLARNRPDASAKFDYATAPPALVERVTAIADIAERHGVTLPEAAIASPRRHPAVAATVLGARTAAQMRTNAARFSADVPDALWGDLEAAGLIPAGSAPAA